jgi:hypothetical protein
MQSVKEDKEAARFCRADAIRQGTRKKIVKKKSLDSAACRSIKQQVQQSAP